MSKLPSLPDRCQRFLDETNRPGGFVLSDCEPPYTHLKFVVVNPNLVHEVPVIEWQAWNDRHGWGDM